MIEAQKKIYLCRPNGKILTQLNGVDTESVEYGVHVKDFNDISFTVQRYILVDGEQVETNGYNDLHVGMNILLEGKDMFQIQEPTISNDGVKEYKTVKGYSLEHEFMEKSWIGLKVNTGEDGSLEYQSKSNLDDFGFSKQYVTFYKPNNSGQTEYSLIHRILEKVPGWSVDDKDIDGVLHDKKIKIDEENINLYALLTSVIAPKAECIFLFDTINKKIKAVAKESLDATYYDTNIFVSMRNLVRTLDVQTNEDSVYTVFNVSGEDDLNIRYVNYNDRYIYDLSYFMAEPWMNQTLIDKIAAWQQWREDNHDLYIQKSKQVEELNDRIYMITYQTPNDGDDWQQWDTMSLEGLNGAYRMFYAYLVAILVSADDDPSYDENDDYIIRRNGAGEIDDDYYKPRLLADSLGYYTYYEIKNYILPNIQIAVDNKGEVEDNKIDYVKEYETDWELYGLNLLDEKKKQISDQILNLADYETDWDDMTDQEKAQYNEMSYKTHHQQLMERIEWYDGLVEREDELNEEKAAVQNQIDALKPELEEFRNKALITHSDWGLTEDELELFNILCKYTDYTNSNIVTTSLTTTTSKFENQEELYKDSVSKLSEVSQPQYSFNVDIDNFFDIPEFAAWKEKFHLLRFMRVGIRDDYSVKLRLIGYTTNPCEIDPMLTVEFSNFITSKSGRSDLTELLQLEGGSSSPNSISIGKGNASDAEEYATNLFYMLSRSGMFKSGANNTASGTTNSTFSGVSTANLINLYTTTGYITDAVMSEAKVTDYLDAVKVNAATVQAGTVIADRILLKGNGSGILYQLNNLGGLESENMSTLDGFILTDNTITADKIVANTITAREITADNIQGTGGWINLRSGTFWYGGHAYNELHPYHSSSEDPYQQAADIAESNTINNSNNWISWSDVTKDGVTQRALVVAGEIYARDGGDIGGFKISTTNNTGTTAQGGHCFKDSLYLQTSNEEYEYETGITNGTTSGYLLPEQTAFYIKCIDKNAAWSNSINMFYIKHNGELYANNANIQGNIAADSGRIGNWNIDSDGGIWSSLTTSDHEYKVSLCSPINAPDGNYSAFFVKDNSTTKFKIKYNGEMIATTGTIGSWGIDTGFYNETSNDRNEYKVYIRPDKLYYYFERKNSPSYVAEFDLNMWDADIRPVITFKYNTTNVRITSTYRPHQIGFVQLNDAGVIQYQSVYGASSCSTPTVMCTDLVSETYSGGSAVFTGAVGFGSTVEMDSTLAVSSSISEGGTTLSQKYMGMEKDTNNYWGLKPNGSNSAWIRTTSNGLIPYQSGGASSLGTSGWPFNTIHGKTIYENGTALSGKYLGLGGGTLTGTLACTATDGTSNRYVICSGDATHRISRIWLNSETKLYIHGCADSTDYKTYAATVAPSDIRLKENVGECGVDNALNIINRIKLHSFDWKRSGKHQKIGFIADELETIDKCFSDGGGYDDNGCMIVKTVDTFYLQGYEIKAIQELSSQISELKSEIKQLKKQLQER